MTQHLLQVNFRFEMPKQDYETAVAFIADQVKAAPGLVWKIWILNEGKQEAGGIYLFASKEALTAYRQSALFKALESNQAFSSMSVKEFGFLEQVSLITNAPLYPFSLLSEKGVVS